MQPFTQSLGYRRGLIFTGLLAASLLVIGQLAKNSPSPSQSMDGIVLKTSPPAEVAIELTHVQLAELEDAFLNGFDNPEPNDPCRRLQLLPFKKLSAWRKQFSKRGFTMEKIRDMLVSGRREAFTHPEKGVTYTKIFDRQGNWIVVDFVDCVIWQVAPYNFK